MKNTYRPAAESMIRFRPVEALPVLRCRRTRNRAHGAAEAPGRSHSAVPRAFVDHDHLDTLGAHGLVRDAAQTTGHTLGLTVAGDPHGRVTVVDRPDELGRSSTPMSELIQYLGRLREWGTMLMTHVTHPFVTAEVFEELIAAWRCVREQGHDSLLTVTKLHTFLWDAQGRPFNYDDPEVRELSKPHQRRSTIRRLALARERTAGQGRGGCRSLASTVEVITAHYRRTEASAPRTRPVNTNKNE